jgi:addiction module HigA family antidote
MAEKIPTPAIGAILKDEFMEPLGLSAYQLAKEVHVPASRILEILHGKRRVTVATALRFSRYFGLSERFFINLQADIDLRNEREALAGELERIKPRTA